MNERIRELAEQAFFDEATSQPSDLMYTFSDHKMQQFAELIVKDCLKQIDKMRDGFVADNEDQQALGAEWAGLAVARYFGDKE
jgi:hypothetical protein